MRHTRIFTALAAIVTTTAATTAATTVAIPLAGLLPAISFRRTYPSRYVCLYRCWYGCFYRYLYEIHNHSRAGIRVLLSSLCSVVTGVSVHAISLLLSKKYTSDKVFTLCCATRKSSSHKKISSLNFKKSIFLA